MSDVPSPRWLLLTAGLAGGSASTARVRLWRALRELGVASLRDGVSLLPASPDARSAFDDLVRQVEAEGGKAWLLELPTQVPAVEEALAGLLDRTAAYGEQLRALAQLSVELAVLDEVAARRRLRQLERALGEIERIDYFPGASRDRARAAIGGVAAEINRRFSPQEPSAAGGAVRTLKRADFRARRWATRRHLWVDRVASAWLIRTFLDPQASFLWLDHPEDCPADALGFDFDRATFTHVGDRVTFEVLLASFGLDREPGLARLGQLVHYLDVGGLPVPEAAGFEAVLAGLRQITADDDALLAAAAPVLDALQRRFSTGAG